MKQVSDDSNFGNAQDTSGLIDATPNSKEFGFCGQNIHSMMDRLGDSFVMSMNMVMEVAMLFLILASVIMRALEESSKEEIIKLSSKSEQDLKNSLLLFLKR